MMKKETYKIKTDCNNCGCNNQDTEIKKGTTVKTGLKTAKCKNCGCCKLEEKSTATESRIVFKHGFDCECSKCVPKIYKRFPQRNPFPLQLPSPNWTLKCQETINSHTWDAATHLAN